MSFRWCEVFILAILWYTNLFTQIACAFAANLMMTCYGLVVPASAFMIPQLEDPVTGFGITIDEGSWLGKKRKYP